MREDEEKTLKKRNKKQVGIKRNRQKKKRGWTDINLEKKRDGGATVSEKV